MVQQVSGWRHKSGGKVVCVRCQTETDCGKASVLAREILNPAFGFAVRQAAACVLPGVQRTDGITVRVHIQNAVHLPGHANGMNIRIAFKQRLITESAVCVIFSTSCSRAHVSADGVKAPFARVSLAK